MIKHGGMEDVFYVFLSKEARTSGLSFIKKNHGGVDYGNQTVGLLPDQRDMKLDDIYLTLQVTGKDSETNDCGIFLIKSTLWWLLKTHFCQGGASKLEHTTQPISSPWIYCTCIQNWLWGKSWRHMECLLLSLLLFVLLFVGVFLLIFALGVASYLWFFAFRAFFTNAHLATFHETKALPAGKMVLSSREKLGLKRPTKTDRMGPMVICLEKS